jgi:hypothetical protein
MSLPFKDAVGVLADLTKQLQGKADIKTQQFDLPIGEGYRRKNRRRNRKCRNNLNFNSCKYWSRKECEVKITTPNFTQVSTTNTTKVNTKTITTITTLKFLTTAS